AGWKRGDGEWQQPSERFGVDQKCVTDPIKACEEIAKAEQPANARGRKDASPSRRRRAMNEPNENGEGDKHGRPKIDRRQGQRRRRAGQKGDQRPAPPPSENDRMRQSDERHGRGAPLRRADSGSVGEAGSAPEVSLVGPTREPSMFASASRRRGSRSRCC